VFVANAVNVDSAAGSKRKLVLGLHSRFQAELFATGSI
jgi:hypothetical protein